MTKTHPDNIVKNEFKVPRKVWGSWTLVGKHVFNKTMHQAIESPWVFDSKPNGVVSIPKDQWRTIAWNFAFVAASLTSRGERHLIKDLEERIKV